VALTRLLIGTRGLFALKSQEWFSEPGWWRLGLIVCSYPEPVRMMRCQKGLQSSAAGIREQFVRCA
jgi:hypothetical protein